MKITSYNSVIQLSICYLLLVFLATGCKTKRERAQGICDEINQILYESHRNTSGKHYYNKLSANFYNTGEQLMINSETEDLKTGRVESGSTSTILFGDIDLNAIDRVPAPKELFGFPLAHWDDEMTQIVIPCARKIKCAQIGGFPRDKVEIDFYGTEAEYQLIRKKLIELTNIAMDTGE